MLTPIAQMRRLRLRDVQRTYARSHSKQVLETEVKLKTFSLFP